MPLRLAALWSTALSLVALLGLDAEGCVHVNRVSRKDPKKLSCDCVDANDGCLAKGNCVPDQRCETDKEDGCIMAKRKFVVDGKKDCACIPAYDECWDDNTCMLDPEECGDEMKPEEEGKDKKCKCCGFVNTNGRGAKCDPSMLYLGKEWCYVDADAQCNNIRVSSRAYAHDKELRWVFCEEQGWPSGGEVREKPKFCECAGVTNTHNRGDQCDPSALYQDREWCYVAKDAPCVNVMESGRDYIRDHISVNLGWVFCDEQPNFSGNTQPCEMMKEGLVKGKKVKKGKAASGCECEAFCLDADVSTDAAAEAYVYDEAQGRCTCLRKPKRKTDRGLKLKRWKGVFSQELN